MDKPKPKQEVKISFTNAPIIGLYASPDAIDDFRSFGLILRLETIPGYYHLTVDARYDFQEVVKYIESYG